MNWLTGLGISEKNLYKYEVPGNDLAHYSERTVDLMYRYFPEGDDEEKQWDELMGIANRADFDTKAPSKKFVDADGNRVNTDTTEDLSYHDPYTNKRFYPYVIEPAIGVNSTLLSVLMDANTEKETDKGIRTILKLKTKYLQLKLPFYHSKRTRPQLSKWQRKSRRI